MQDTMIIGSRPNIITRGENPRVNKDNLNNIFLKKYINLLAQLLLVKKDLSKINIAYIGGYDEINNVSRAKLFISAFNYYLTDLGYASLRKDQITIIDENNIDQEKIEECDFLFLGVGADRILAKNVKSLEKQNIFLNKMIKEKNLLVLTVCSGSVMIAKRIYGSMYDHYFANEEIFNYPKNIPSLNLSDISLEPSYSDNELEKPGCIKFEEQFLRPDSYKLSFFACFPDSFFLTSQDKTILYGKAVLFIDGEKYLICDEFQNVDITYLIKLINAYNNSKENNINNTDLKVQIIALINNLKRESITTDLTSSELNIIEEYKEKELTRLANLNKKNEQAKKDLKDKINNLFSKEFLDQIKNNPNTKNISTLLKPSIIDSFYLTTEDKNLELILKMNLLSIVKKSFTTYNGYFTDFKKMLYSLLEEYLTINPLVVYYFLTICGSIYTNSELKKLLKNLSFADMKRPQAIINDTIKRRCLFKTA